MIASTKENRISRMTATSKCTTNSTIRTHWVTTNKPIATRCTALPSRKAEPISETTPTHVRSKPMMTERRTLMIWRSISNSSKRLTGLQATPMQSQLERMAFKANLSINELILPVSDLPDCASLCNVINLQVYPHTDPNHPTWQRIRYPETNPIGALCKWSVTGASTACSVLLSELLISRIFVLHLLPLLGVLVTDSLAVFTLLLLDGQLVAILTQHFVIKLLIPVPERPNVTINQHHQ